MSMFCRTLCSSKSLEAVAWTNICLVVAKSQHFGFFLDDVDFLFSQLNEVGVVVQLHSDVLRESGNVYPFGYEISYAVIFSNIFVAISMVVSRDFESALDAVVYDGVYFPICSLHVLLSYF